MLGVLAASVAVFVLWCWLFNTSSKGMFSPGFTHFAGLSSLLSVWGASIRECQQGQEVLSLSRMSLNIYVAPTIRDPSAIFRHSWMSDYYRVLLRLLVFSTADKQFQGEKLDKQLLSIIYITVRNLQLCI